jgi:protein-tyrosine phosphatase
MPVKILFVCLGNICRSPTAEAVFAAKLAEAGLQDQIQIDSCGTGDWHIGKAPDARARAAASERGYAMDHLRARQVTLDDFQRFDYVLAMDQDNYDDLVALCPDESRAQVGRFMDYHPQPGLDEVPDPYYGGDQGFDYVLDLVEQASEGLVEYIQRHHFMSRY